MNRVPTQQDIEMTCLNMAEKLAGGEDSRCDMKIALVDVLDEALQGKVLGVRTLFLSPV